MGTTQQKKTKKIKKFLGKRYTNRFSFKNCSGIVAPPWLIGKFVDVEKHLRAKGAAMCVKLAPTIVTKALAGMEEAMETMNLSKSQNRSELFNGRAIKDCSAQHYFSICMKFLRFLALIGDYCSMVIFTPHHPKYV